MTHTLHNALLLTPGPVTLSMATKREMLADHAMDGERITRDLGFCRDYLLQLANARGIAAAIPLAGPATGANEAAIQTLVPPGGKLLVAANGVFGDRLAAICAAIGLRHRVLRLPPTEPVSAAKLRTALSADAEISHVMAVHCETSSGLLNPVEEIADLCRERGKKLLLDVVSTFGALATDMRALRCEALILGCNKCLEGPPGLAWVIANLDSLKAAKGHARSLTLDLWEQWRHFETEDSFRFTPPTHVIAAFAQALREHQNEGGQKARLSRYARNRARLVDGLRELGFTSLLPPEIAAPIVATFLAPNDAAYDPIRFAQRMSQQGFQISLRRAAVPNLLRLGCMGDLDESRMTAAVKAAGRALRDMRVTAPPPEHVLPQAQFGP
jgi:2-aminoethylphosphonate-pyruvate transaminase